MAEKISTWWKGLKAEYSKIIWESRENVTKQTVAVVIISVVVGVIIALVDWILKNGIDFITTL